MVLLLPAIRAVSRSAKPSLSRSVAAYHATTLQKGGMTPPMAPYARSPARYEKMVENTDCLWDDGVAPELALDFDVPNMSSNEALLTLGSVLGFFTFFYQGICKNFAWENPALNSKVDNVVPDYANHEEWSLKTTEDED